MSMSNASFHKLQISSCQRNYIEWIIRWNELTSSVTSNPTRWFHFIIIEKKEWAVFVSSSWPKQKESLSKQKKSWLKPKEITVRRIVCETHTLTHTFDENCVHDIVTVKLLPTFACFCSFLPAFVRYCPHLLAFTKSFEIRIKNGIVQELKLSFVYFYRHFGFLSNCLCEYMRKNQHKLLVYSKRMCVFSFFFFYSSSSFFISALLFCLFQISPRWWWIYKRNTNGHTTILFMLVIR